MPKTPSIKLFNLVKSLSGPEKRYFKIFVGTRNQSDNKYLLLFDAIDAQDTFNEKALKLKVYGTTDIRSRKYSELKAYLYDLILRSLQAYDEKSSVNYRLKSMLQSIQALFRRSLFDDCLDHMAKAKKLATKYEQFTVLIEILSWEKQIAYTMADIDFLDKELNRIDAEEKEILRRLRNISEYRNVFFRLLVSLRKDASLRGEAFKTRLSGIITSPLFNNTAQAGSHQAKVLYYRTLSIYHLALSDLDKFYDYSKTLIELMESKPHFLKEDVSEYISALSNLIVSCGKLGKYDELEHLLEKMRMVKPLSLDDELKIHRQYYQNKFSLCVSKGAFEEAMHALKAHLKERKKYAASLFETNSFYHNYFYIAFGAGQYDLALAFLNQWLSLPNTVERQDLQVVARILNLLIHFELGNYVLLDSLIRSTQRFLKKKDRLGEVERKIINFIRRAAGTPSKKELREAYESLKKEFEDLSEQPATKRFFTSFFDIMSWIESKIERKSFAQIIQAKFSEKYNLP
jgi:hypothetical protein